MAAITLVFPHQLFKKHPAVAKGRTVYLVEEELYFSQYNFHQKKLVLHRASMKYYADSLERKGITVKYIDATNPQAAITKLVAGLPKTITEIHYADVVDDWLQQRLEKAARKKGISLQRYNTPMFLNSLQDVEPYFEKHPRYFQTDFYIAQRKQRQLLLEKNDKPIGGRWTFDDENRERWPKGHRPPEFTLPDNQKYVPDAIEYVQKHFGDNYGSTEAPFFKRKGFYPVTHKEAEDWLEEFIATRLKQFGPYEDAMAPGETILYHSCITPMLNIGLLTPQQVLDTVLEAASQKEIPLNSLEGYVRQLTGWREFIRIVYEHKGRMQRTKNYWGFTRKIPASFWAGNTGIDPVDIVIQKTLESGWSHHIERLMIMGNFMLLCEFDPDEVYRWFMEMYVDAYDWVMVPNTYGMISFADGGLMMTKPYISGSNYVMKMGHWNSGPWQEVWDGLFWRFMHVHRDFFGQNPRLGMLLKSFDKMPKAKQQTHLANAEYFLKSLDATPT